jgi:hypothetical protein
MDISAISMTTMWPPVGGKIHGSSARDTQCARTGIFARMSDSIRRIDEAVRAIRSQETNVSCTARLLHAGPRKIAKKNADAADEVAIEATAENRDEIFWGAPF